jgi:hypothetical protein
MRSRIEVYWNSVDTAPAGEPLQVRVTDGSEDYLLPYACKLTPDGGGQRSHWLAIAGAAHVLEALLRNPTEQERLETKEGCRPSIRRRRRSKLKRAQMPLRNVYSHSIT